MRKFLILLVVAFLAAPLDAQWRRAGLHGADVRALIAHPDDPDLLFLGTSGGEVYVSTDGAKKWENPRESVPFPGYVVDSLVLDRDGRLWSASWGLWGGGVVAVSSDNGKTWLRRDKGIEDLSVRAIAIDPHDPDYILTGGLTGVYRSVDGGATWEKFSEHVNVESLAIDPRTRDRIYVGTWRQGWRSDDGGKNWKHIANGMVLDTDMFAITFHPRDPDNIWVSTCGWVYNTENRGDKWTRYRDGFKNRRIHTVDVDPADETGQTIYAGSVAGLYRTDDGGKKFYPVSNEDLVINSVVLHPKRPGRVIIGVEGDGVYVSHDRAKTFARLSEGLNNLRITTLAADPLAKDRVYAAVAFGGAASGIYKSDDAGKNWKRVSSTTLPEVLSLAIAPEKESEARLVAGTEKGFFWSKDGVEWTQAPPLHFPIRVNKIVRFNQNRSFAATSEGVFTTRDGGKEWYRLASSLEKAVDIVVGYVGERRALYALTNSGLLAFDGDQWLNVHDAPSKGRTIAVRSIEGKQHVFIAGSEGVRAGRVDSFGRWHPADAPDAKYASVFGAARNADDLLFLTSRQQREVLIGTPQERDWQELTLPLPGTQITSIAPDPFEQRYYVGTTGGGVFIYEGLTRRYVQREEPAGGGAVTAGGGGSR
ncbi:MAG TPA: YCF48-related protein [Thermoanaerobaculia bacterium]|nr:YCF48-related protein [Thermoanaerobaculia bacterium]